MAAAQAVSARGGHVPVASLAILLALVAATEIRVVFRTLRPVSQTASNGLNRAFCPSGDELLPITRPTPLRDIDHDDSELREQFERAGSRFAEETIPSEQTPEASVHRRLHQISVRQCLPAAIPRGVAVNSETGQDGCEMYVRTDARCTSMLASSSHMKGAGELGCYLQDFG